MQLFLALRHIVVERMSNNGSPVDRQRDVS
jgi:hypothetical protein